MPDANVFNPLVRNGLSHPYHLDESTFRFRDTGSNFLFLFNFSIKFMSANRRAPDGTLRFAASHLGLFCLPMSHKKDARLIWVKNNCCPILCKRLVNYTGFSVWSFGTYLFKKSFAVV